MRLSDREPVLAFDGAPLPHAGCEGRTRDHEDQTDQHPDGERLMQYEHAEDRRHGRIDVGDDRRANRADLGDERCE